MLKRFIEVALVAVSVAVGIGLANATTVDLIVNGNFETGTFAGWSTPSIGSGANDFYIIANGANGPISGHPNQLNVGGGAFVALADQGSAGGETLIQGFTVLPSYTSLILSFDWFNNTHSPYSGVAIDGSAQSGRVDILWASATPFDVGAGVVQNLLLNAGSFTNFGTTIPWRNLTFDLSGLTPGNYQLRFGQGECCFYQETGVDNVRLLATTIPEPSSLLLFMLALLSVGVRRSVNSDLASQYCFWFRR